MSDVFTGNTQKDRAMDIVWIVAGLAFFGMCWGLVSLFGILKVED